MTQTESAGHVGVVTDRKDAAGGFDFAIVDYQRSVVKGGVFEEDVFNEACVDRGVDDVAAFLVVVERHILLDNNQGSGLAFRHAHAGIDWALHVCGGLRSRPCVGDETGS